MRWRTFKIAAAVESPEAWVVHVEDNSEAMKLVEQERDNYNELSAKEVEISLNCKVLNDKLWTLEMHTKYILKKIDCEINMNPNNSILDDMN